MASLVIPSSGLRIGGFSRPSANFPEAIGLSLSNSVIEQMIRCAQKGDAIQLSMGDSPNITFGTKTQHLGTATDSSSEEIFRTSSQNPIRPSPKASVPHPAPRAFNSPKLTSTLAAVVSRKFISTKLSEKQRAEAASSSVTGKKLPKAGGDAALAALQSSLATESMKKAENTVKYIKDGSLPVPGKRGARKIPGKSNCLSQRNESSKSLPISPITGTAPVPLSQQQAEHAKAVRKPVIHHLAVAPLSEAALQSRVPGSKEQDLKQALQKVGDLNEATGKWELRKTFYKELDVWNFRYDQASDRQQAIDNAVKIFDKMRLNVSEPQWEKLLSRSERGTGKCLSKLQAQIAQASNQKAPKASDTGRDSPYDGRDDGSKEKNALKSNGESMARSGSQGSTKSKKAITEKQAQAKRLLSKKPLTSKPPTSKNIAKKAAAPKKCQPPTKTIKAETKPISAEFVHSSEEEDVTPAEVKTKSNKRPRATDEAEISNQKSMPVLKKAKRETITKSHRVSDASLTSRTTSTSLFSTFSGKSTKSTSPTKTSPLASSPTNTSDFDQSSGSQSSTSTSPPNRNQKTNIEPVRRLKPEVMHTARKYKMYYPQYLHLHQQITEMGDRRDRVMEKDLLDMHTRLVRMKKEILAGIVDIDVG